MITALVIEPVKQPQAAHGPEPAEAEPAHREPLYSDAR